MRYELYGARIIAALFMILALSACNIGGSSGGGGGSSEPDPTPDPDPDPVDTGPFTIGGTITGLEDYVVLSLNGVSETFSTASFTFTQELDAGTEYNIAVVSTGGDLSCSVVSGSGTANADVLGVSITCLPSGDVDYLCADQSTMTTNITGNNTYEFIANDDDCFATTEDFSLQKREVPLSLNLEEEFEDLLTVSDMAKLTTKEVPGGLGTYTTITLAAEITNESEAVVCLDFEIEGALVRDGDTQMAYLQAELLGDMFYEDGFYTNLCIPAGQSRIVWGRGSNIYDEGEVDALDNILLQPKDIEVYALDDDHYFLPPLTPSEAIWSSSREEIAGNDYYGYEIEVSFTNENAASLMLRSEYSTLYYFDEDGYFLFKNLSSVFEYLDIDRDDLTDADLTLDADGGTIGLKDDFYPIVPAFGATGQILGRASKIIMNLNLCPESGC